MHSMWLHWRERHLLTTQQVAVDAIVAMAVDAVDAVSGAATESLTTRPEAQMAAVTTTTQPSAAQPSEARHVSSGLMAAYATVQAAYEQHWSAVAESELSEYCDWGKAPAKAACCTDYDRLQKAKEATWQAAMAECQQTIQQLQQVKLSAVQGDTPGQGS
jgi:hypothetical protein